MNLSHIALAGVLVLAAASARADDLYFHSSDGPMEIHIDQSGRVHGRYQQESGAQRPGRLVGTAGGNGSLEGLWLQPKSDHPCGYPREGSYTWGRFTIGNAWGAYPYGSWGYCDEIPNRNWQIRR